jgi:hypothetical protein
VSVTVVTRAPAGPIIDADLAISADLVLVALDAPRSHPPPQRTACHVIRAGPPPVTPELEDSEKTKTLGMIEFH